MSNNLSQRAALPPSEQEAELDRIWIRSLEQERDFCRKVIDLLNEADPALAAEIDHDGFEFRILTAFDDRYRMLWGTAEEKWAADVERIGLEDSAVGGIEAEALSKSQDQKEVADAMLAAIQRARRLSAAGREPWLWGDDL